MKKIICLLVLCISLSLCLCSCIDLSSLNIPGVTNQNQTEPELNAEYIYSLAKDAGYTGTLEQFINEFKGEDGKDGKDGNDGKDGVGIAGAAINQDSHLVLTLTNGNTVDCGKISSNVELQSSSISIGSNGNWYINGEDTGKKAEATDGATWLTGSGVPTASLGNDGDLYLDTLSCDVYKKVRGSWSIISNISGDGFAFYEGDRYEININTEDGSARYAASKALMSSVMVESVFSRGNNQLAGNVANGAGVIFMLTKQTGDAYIITNYHVVYDKDASTENKIADTINIYVYGMAYSDYKIRAEYVGGSLTYDIAVLKVSDSDIIKDSAELRPVDIADSESVELLDTAIAIGNPASSGFSATLGSVSVKSEYIKMLAPDNETEIEYRVMRIDTPVNSGNSGGGLFNSKGELIGIVNAKQKDTSLENMGYAIPSNLVLYVANNIIRNCDGMQNEQVIKGRLGIEISISDIKTEYDEKKGILKVIETCVVSKIEEDSVVKGILQEGDVIDAFEIDGIYYLSKHNYDGGEILLNANPYSEIYVYILRNGEPYCYKLNLTESNFSKIP